MFGYATIVDSFEMTIEELLQYSEKHQANDFIKRYANARKTLFAWVLGDVRVELAPQPYSYSAGSWCRIEKSNEG